MTTDIAVPDVQRAWVVVDQGPPRQVLKLKSDWPVLKKLEPGYVLVKIQAAALNPVGYKMMSVTPDFVFKRPYVADYDIAGVIVDENDSTFKKGDEVFGWTFAWVKTAYQKVPKQGALSEYAVVAASSLALKPKNITPVQAAGVTLTALTALHNLDEAGLEEGQTILVNGGSTAVGSFAIQLAKIRGAKVVAVASGKNEQYFIDYTKVGPLHKYLAENPPSPKFNVILEAVGLYDPSLYTYSKNYLAPNGVYLSAGPQPTKLASFDTLWNTLRFATVFLPSFLTGYKPKFAVPLVTNENNRLERLRAWLEEGKLKPLVDSVFNFENALEAYDRAMTFRATGKVVVKVDNSLES
ncbi:quinone oxidoreductase-like protein [Coprinopsis cinerea okayama7|uniref:Quinone oxidoreductase-like protein n=1 Tax=Coprinopsis cinerea (strain Okayama-7 / 130 / ATCC MYA-4618 / FGSC 9003) TaxID=240176 RepID=D6RKR4_COPC7|nr:quinone oxidoreductase-like protein [Coprinopsis cinerea okayama7\|eukprot:XP_002911936.1 quinone oxidoreductase-like protein [Coprinopsis cinerea okayama7\